MAEYTKVNVKLTNLQLSKLKKAVKNNDSTTLRISIKNLNKEDLPHEFLKKKNFMAPFYGWGSTASRLEPLRGGSLLFTTKFPEVPGTHFIDLGRMKG